MRFNIILASMFTNSTAILFALSGLKLCVWGLTTHVIYPNSFIYIDHITTFNEGPQSRSYSTHIICALHPHFEMVPRAMYMRELRVTDRGKISFSFVALNLHF